MKIKSSKFREPEDYKKLDDIPIIIHSKKCYDLSSIVIFIHGIFGHRYGYWGNVTKFIFDDVRVADIGLYYYKTVFSRIKIYESIDLEEEARVLADAICGMKTYKSIILVGHSMGGLLAKAAVVDLINRRRSDDLRRITGLLLLACPQLGSRYVPSFLGWLSKDARVLRPHNKTISSIDAIWNAHISVSDEAEVLNQYKISTWAAIAAEDFWVDALSAGIGIPEGQKMTFRGSHSGILAPRDKSSPPYRFIKDFIISNFSPSNESSFNIGEISLDDARVDDVPFIRDMAVRFFGDGVTPEDVLTDFAKRGGILKVVKNRSSEGGIKRERVSGYFCAIPLSENARKAILEGRLTGGGLNMRHLPGEGEAEAIYIGAIAAAVRNGPSRAVILEGLRLYLMYLAKIGIKEFITKPVTADGLRLVEKHNFKPTRESGGVNELYVLRTTNI